MTQDEIIKLAREAGLPMAWISGSGVLNWTDLKAFANLIAAHKAEVALAEAYRCGHEAGAVAEREACADIVDNADTPDCGGWNALGISRAIRARGTT